jgi:hypothetical protein
MSLTEQQEDKYKNDKSLAFSYVISELLTPFIHFESSFDDDNEIDLSLPEPVQHLDYSTSATIEKQPYSYNIGDNQENEHLRIVV